MLWGGGCCYDQNKCKQRVFYLAESALYPSFWEKLCIDGLFVGGPWAVPYRPWALGFGLWALHRAHGWAVGSIPPPMGGLCRGLGMGLGLSMGSLTTVGVVR